MVIGKGLKDRYLSDDEVKGVVTQAVASLRADGKRVLIIIPDGTRTMPIPQMFSLFQEFLLPRASAMDYLIALGTHQPMSDEQLTKHVGQPVLAGRVPPKGRREP